MTLVVQALPIICEQNADEPYRYHTVLEWQYLRFHYENQLLCGRRLEISLH